MPRSPDSSHQRLGGGRKIPSCGWHFRRFSTRSVQFSSDLTDLEHNRLPYGRERYHIASHLAQSLGGSAPLDVHVSSTRLICCENLNYRRNHRPGDQAKQPKPGTRRFFVLRQSTVETKRQDLQYLGPITHEPHMTLHGQRLLQTLRVVLDQKHPHHRPMNFLRSSFPSRQYFNI